MISYPPATNRFIDFIAFFLSLSASATCTASSASLSGSLSRESRTYHHNKNNSLPEPAH